MKRFHTSAKKRGRHHVIPIAPLLHENNILDICLASFGKIINKPTHDIEGDLSYTTHTRSTKISL